MCIRDRASISQPIVTGLQRLKSWRERRIDDLGGWQEELQDRQGRLHSHQQKKLDSEKREVERMYQARKVWIDEGMRTVNEPYLRVAAVLIPMEAR